MYYQACAIEVTFLEEDVDVNWRSFSFLKTSRDTLNLKLNIKWNLSNIHTEATLTSTPISIWEGFPAYLFEILVSPSPTSYKLTSFGFLLLIWGIFCNFMKWPVIILKSWTSTGYF
jgi:hypothetical protein